MFTPDLAGVSWTRSSFSTSGQCVELAHGTTWTKSSYSHEGTCVELASNAVWTAVRDSKNPEGPPLVLSRAAMEQFLAGVKASEFDH